VYRELDDARMLVLDRRSGRMKYSGIVGQWNGAHLFHVQTAKVTRLVAYADRDRALADLGLTE